MRRPEVDQSGKIEQTDKDTVLAVANNIKKCVLLKASVKRRLVRLLREESILPEIFYPKIFCAVLFILLKPFSDKTQEFIVDEEYTGKERQIKVILNEYAQKTNMDSIANKIVFRQVGKKSPAHILAWKTRRDKSDAYEIRMDEVLALIL